MLFQFIDHQTEQYCQNYLKTIAVRWQFELNVQKIRFIPKNLRFKLKFEKFMSTKYLFRIYSYYNRCWCLN